MEDSKILKFWNWFEANESKIVPGSITDKFIELLNQKIISIADIAWEIGPGQNKTYMICFLNQGDSELLKTTKRIAQLAPRSLTEWEVLLSKPPKDWNFKFSIFHDGQKVVIDASNWEYL